METEQNNHCGINLECILRVVSESRSYPGPQLSSSDVRSARNLSDDCVINVNVPKSS